MSMSYEARSAEFESVRDQWLKMNGLGMDFVLSGGLMTDADKQKSWQNYYLANTSSYCLTCHDYHKPTDEHPLCRLCKHTLHTPAPEGIFFDYRGWIFTPPFICMSCGIEVCFRQWAFSRSCGPCDLSESNTRLLLPKVQHPHYKQVGMCFAGPHRPSKKRDKRDIVAESFLSPDRRGEFSLEKDDPSYIAQRKALEEMIQSRNKRRK